MPRYFSQEEIEHLPEDLEVVDKVVNAVLKGDEVPEEQFKEAIETAREYADIAWEKTEMDRRHDRPILTGEWPIQ